LIARIKDSIKIPVIGSGDVTGPSLALKMRSETNCDGVMIGRAALVNPWIFRQILTMEESGDYHTPSLDERFRLIMKHYMLLVRHLGENRANQIIRGLLLLYTKGLPHRRLLRESLSKIEGREKLVSIAGNYFGSLQMEMIGEG